jgi:YD repeat-containing protein
VSIALISVVASHAVADEPEASAPTEAAEPLAPDAADISEAFERVRRQEEAREEELEEPRFVAEREASRTEYADATPAEVEELLRAKFGETLAEMNLDPARFLSNAELDRPLGESAGVVTKEGQTSLMEGPIPVEAENEAGELEKVDLSLEASPEGFEPENPIVDTTIGATAEEGVELGGEEGLEVTQAGADDSSGRAFGDKNILFPEVDEGSETDLLVSPTASGVELSDLLRSVDSPDTLRFHLSLPAGASLHLVAGGAAEVEGSDGSTLALIPKPSGVDAQGTYVPVALEVEGDSIVLQTHHREEDLAYPIFIDPEVVYEDWQHPNWYENQRLGAIGYWHWESNYAPISHPPEDPQWPGHHGLFIATPNGTLPGGIYGENYVYRNLGSYIQNATVNIFWRANQGCTAPNPYPEPYDFDGLYDAAQHRWNEEHFNDANKYGNSVFPGWGHEFVEGMGTSYATSIPCWRDTMVGGMELWWGDWGGPELTTVSGMPSGWIKMDNAQRTISVAARSGGLGVQKIRLFGVGGREYAWNQPWCRGTLEEACSEFRSGTITYETSGAASYEGEQTFTVQALDPDQHGEHSKQYSLKLDGLPPSISMSGQLATATAPEGVDKLSLPVYNLTVKAKDLLSTGGIGSGVRRVKVFIDGKEVAGSGPTCSSSSCPGEYEATYQVPLTALTETEHQLEARAVDFVGNETPTGTWLKKFEYIPATGMKEEYVLQHFVLPDGKNHEGEEYEGPELAVNVMNGNVVYHERDLQVEGEGGRNLELERIYNSMQPTTRDGQWGHGWSLAQTPAFTPENAEATNAKMLRTSAVTSAVTLPQSTSAPTFSSRLHATVAKTTGGNYEVRSASEEATQIFNSSGRLEETRLSSVSPEVTVQPEPVFPVYAESVGSPGAGSGQLSHPADVAVDSVGNRWVVDKGNNRIVEYNEGGEPIREVGGLGSAGGKLSSPSGIVIDSSGNLDVTDTANNRVAQFSSTGAFIEVIGANVNKTKVEVGGSTLEKNRCTAASGNVCQAGTAGSGEGQMAEPIGITTTGGTNLFVVERANNRVEKFSTQGERLAGFGSLGSESGQLKEPTAIAFHGFLLWVADTGNERMEAFTTSYVYSRKFGGEGSGNGPLGKPVAVEADASGNVWVAEQASNRLQEFSQTGDYIAQFGGEGQFAFSSPVGTFLDSGGGLWVTDSERGQVQEWLTGESLFAGSMIGSYGSGNGQFNHSADVALDGKGNLWALDKGNNRLEKFNEKGEFVSAVGTKGGGAGQMNAPSALAIDPSGNLWVADTANNRIEEWSEAGQFVLTFGREVNKTKVETTGATEAEKNLCTAASGNICQAGVAGSASGQLKGPKGLAFTTSGTIWITDTGNNRLEKFSNTGGLISTLSGEGSEPGKLKEPTAITVAPDGSKWVADTGNNRIEQWNVNNSFVRAVGKEGSGNGEFEAPVAIEADSAGSVWVGEGGNDRIQEFSSSGEYVAQFGSSSRFAFSGPMGLASDTKGGLWITDTDHNRVQRLFTSEFETPIVTQAPAINYSYSGAALTEMKLKEPEAPDPAITVANSSGLTTSASSESTSATYTYASGNLTAEKDAEGEVKYERDESNRLAKVTLPNGTWAKVTYDSYGRATKVVVRPAGGVEKTTNFKYELSPRKTYVWGTANPEVIYYIGEDGSVLKWANVVTPPTLFEPKGSLWGHRNDPTPIESKDQTLLVTAESQNEIASIKVISGNAVLADQTCEDKSEPPAHNCVRPPTLEWITNPAEHSPGRLDLEVVATDFQGKSSSERFFVTIPQQPPVDPEAPERPSFDSTKRFREEFGLDRAHPLTQAEMNKLVLELLYEWEAQMPSALYAVENWGIPLRAPEIAELELRERYIQQATELIPIWAEEHAASSFGGYYVNQAAGGKIYVGFTSEQATHLAALKSEVPLIEPGQVFEYPTAPTTSIVSAEGTEGSVEAALLENLSAAGAATTISTNLLTGKVQVGATDVGSVQSYLDSRFGPGAIEVLNEGAPQPLYARFQDSGGVDGGDELQSGLVECENGNIACLHVCTAGFSARDRQNDSVTDGPLWKFFILTAGHCFNKGSRALRSAQRETFANPKVVGEVTRQALDRPGGGLKTDAEAISVDPSLTSEWLYVGHPRNRQLVNNSERVRIGQTLCWSGINGGVHCGEARRWVRVRVQGHFSREMLVGGKGSHAYGGDSGGPVWNRKTKAAVGMMSVGFNCDERKHCQPAAITPLLPRENTSIPWGALNELSLKLNLP